MLALALVFQQGKSFSSYIGFASPTVTQSLVARSGRVAQSARYRIAEKFDVSDPAQPRRNGIFPTLWPAEFLCCTRKAGRSLASLAERLAMERALALFAFLRRPVDAQKSAKPYVRVGILEA